MNVSSKEAATPKITVSDGQCRASCHAGLFCCGKMSEKYVKLSSPEVHAPSPEVHAQSKFDDASSKFDDAPSPEVHASSKLDERDPRRFTRGQNWTARHHAGITREQNWTAREPPQTTKIHVSIIFYHQTKKN